MRFCHDVNGCEWYNIYLYMDTWIPWMVDFLWESFLLHELRLCVVGGSTKKTYFFGESWGG